MLTRLREPLLPLAAAASLALVLIVVVATAAIRLSGGDLGDYLAAVRMTHRASASIATLFIAPAAWLAWRAGRRPLAAAIVLATAFLSILGAATGISPPPLAQAGNLLGGLALAALLAALFRAGTRAASAWPFVPLVVLQVCLGAWLSIFAETLWGWALVVHATLGCALALGAAWLATHLRHALGRFALLVLALAVPASGISAALFDLPLGAALAHSASVVFLLVALSACLTHIKWGAPRF